MELYLDSVDFKEIEAALDGSTLVLKHRPDTVIRLQPTAKDEFRGGSREYRFIRNANGSVNELSLRGSRVFDLRFKRQSSGT